MYPHSRYTNSASKSFKTNTSASSPFLSSNRSTSQARTHKSNSPQHLTHSSNSSYQAHFTRPSDEQNYSYGHSDNKRVWNPSVLQQALGRDAFHAHISDLQQDNQGQSNRRDNLGTNNGKSTGTRFADTRYCTTESDRTGSFAESDCFPFIDTRTQRPMERNGNTNRQNVNSRNWYSSNSPNSFSLYEHTCSELPSPQERNPDMRSGSHFHASSDRNYSHNNFLEESRQRPRDHFERSHSKLFNPGYTPSSPPSSTQPTSLCHYTEDYRRKSEERNQDNEM